MTTATMKSSEKQNSHGMSRLFEPRKKFELTLTEINEEKISITPEAFGNPDPLTCEFCGKYYEPVGIHHPFEKRIFAWKPLRCDCEKAVEEQKRLESEEKERGERAEKKKRIEDLFLQSRISVKFRKRTFENFQTNPDNQEAFDVCFRYSENFKNMGGSGIFLIGPYGTGKTHLAASIANKLIPRGIPVIFGTLISLFDKVKQSFNDNGLTQWEILDIYNSVDLLIIDDLGKEKVSEWTIEKLYSIVNSRYENEKPMIITSNFTSKALIDRLTITGNDTSARAIVSRLSEMCAGVKLSGADWRLR